MNRIRFKGYSSFIKKTEGKKDNPSGMYQWSTEDLRNVEVYSLENICLARTKSRESYLLNAFCWRTTPQGNDYWIKRYNGTQALTQEDRQFLKELYDYYKYKPRPHADSPEQSPPF